MRVYRIGKELRLRAERDHDHVVLAQLLPALLSLNGTSIHHGLGPLFFGDASAIVRWDLAAKPAATPSMSSRQSLRPDAAPKTDTHQGRRTAVPKKTREKSRAR